MRIHSVRVRKVTRLASSVSGNPRYRFDTNVGTLRTAPDSSVAYAVTGGWRGRLFTMTCDGRGNVIAADDVTDDPTPDEWLPASMRRA